MDSTAHVTDHGLLQLCQSVKHIFMKMSLYLHEGSTWLFHDLLYSSAVVDEEGVQGDSTAAARSSLEPTTGCGES